MCRARSWLLVRNTTRNTGRGLTLIRSFMDDVQFSDRGNEILLIKRRATLPSSLLPEADVGVLADLSTVS